MSPPVLISNLILVIQGSGREHMIPSEITETFSDHLLRNGYNLVQHAGQLVHGDAL